MKAPLLLSCVLALTVACSHACAESGPPPIPPIVSVTPMSTVQQSPVVQGRDGTYSAEFNGTSYWVFGDTTLTVDNASGTNFFSNSMAWATNLDASGGIVLNGNYVDSSGEPAQFIPFLPNEAAYNAAHSSTNCTAEPCGANLALWAGPIVPDPARNRMLVFFIEIWRAPGYSGWITLGEGVAIWQNGTVTRPVVNPNAPYPTLLWQGSQIGFTYGWVVSGETLYMYGNVTLGLTKDTQVARVNLANVTTLDDWTYYAGNGVWSAKPSEAVTVFNGGAAGSSVFYDAFLGMYVAIYSGVLNSNLYYNVSYTPWGPWSAPTLFYVGLPAYQNNADYAALAHPEFASGNGQTQYVTYVQDTGFLAQQLQQLQIVFGPPTP
jgi:hypothetical protein